MSNRTTGSLFLTLLVALFLITSCGGRPKVAEKNKSGRDTLTVLLQDLSKKISDHPSDPDLLQQRSKYYLLDHQEKLAFEDITKAISLSGNRLHFTSRFPMFIWAWENLTIAMKHC